MLTYGGGGHRAVGARKAAHEDADRAIDELVGQLNADAAAQAGRRDVT